MSNFQVIHLTQEEQNIEDLIFLQPTREFNSNFFPSFQTTL